MKRQDKLIILAMAVIIISAFAFSAEAISLSSVILIGAVCAVITALFTSADKKTTVKFKADQDKDRTSIVA